MNFTRVIGSILLATSVPASAQMTLLSGTQMQVANGTTMHLAQGSNWAMQPGADLLNDGTIVLATGTTLSEAAGSPIHGTGTERIVAYFSIPLSQVNIGGLGAELTTAIATDSVRIVRGHVPYVNTLGDPGIKRWFSIDPDVNNGLNAMVVFHYDDTELNAIPELNLAVSRSNDGGNTWNYIPTSINTTQNTAMINGLNALSLFTLFVDSAHVGTNDPFSAPQAMLYPTITYGPMELVNEEPFSHGELTIFDATGRLVARHQQSPSRRIPIDVSDLRPGHYHLRTQEGRHFKFIKQ